MSEPRIYTKLGDDGSTGLLFGGRTSKADPLIDTLGCIDETVASLGLARANATDPHLATQILQLQRDLFVAAADLAANPHARDRLVPDVSLMTPAMTSRIESLIDELVAQRPLRPVFVVPGARQHDDHGDDHDHERGERHEAAAHDLTAGRSAPPGRGGALLRLPLLFLPVARHPRRRSS